MKKNEEKRGLLSRLFSRNSAGKETQEQKEQETPPAAAAPPPPPKKREMLDGPLCLLAYYVDSGPADKRPLDSLLGNGVEVTEEVMEIFRELQGKAEPLCRALEKADGEEGAQPEPIPGEFCIFVSRSSLSAWGFFFPPLFGAEDWALEDAQDAVAARGVKVGVDEEELRQAVEGKRWMKLFLLAEGKAPQDGADGSVEELFARERELRLIEDEHGAVDHKDLHLLQPVQEGEVLCRITLPGPAVDGVSVYGQPLRGKAGKAAKVPRGNNTRLSEDGKELRAACAGQLSFVGDTFRVEKVVTIDGDVGPETGNLDAIGDMVVNGNVMAGFSVQCTGTITVRGLVEGAKLKAGGNIQVALGVKANSELEAEGEVLGKFVENCRVHAKGNVVADSIINSEVYAGKRVVTVTGHGVIIGGRVVGCEGIEAHCIGNASNRQTALVIGSDPEKLALIREKKKQLTEMRRLLEETEKNIAFLEGKSVLTPRQQKLLSDMRLKQSVDKMKLSNSERQIKAMEAEKKTVRCFILADSLYPPTTIEIESVHYVVQSVSRMCRIYKEDGEIVVGSR